MAWGSLNGMQSLETLIAQKGSRRQKQGDCNGHPPRSMPRGLIAVHYSAHISRSDLRRANHKALLEELPTACPNRGRGFSEVWGLQGLFSFFLAIS